MAYTFSSAIAKWKEIHFIELQKSMVMQAEIIVGKQRESLLSRRALADKTKELKKIPETDKPNAFKKLLKAYQIEIDELSNRCKACEGSFLNVYKLLAEAPDPYPLLETAVDQTVIVAEALEAEAELHQLREEKVALRRRVGELSLLENAKKEAEAKVEHLETKMNNLIQETVNQKENELHAIYDERLRNYEDREQYLQRQVALVKTQLYDLRTSNDSNQEKLLNHSQRQDREFVAKLAEMEIIVADLDQSKSRIAAVERRNETLRAEIEATCCEQYPSDRVKVLEAQVSQLDEEAQRLSAALDSQRLLTSHLEATIAKQADETTRDLQENAKEAEQLKQKLKQYVDYEEIKRELDIMKHVEFAGIHDAINETNALQPISSNSAAENINDKKGQSLEFLLAIQNKRIVEELARFRIMHSELEESLRVAQNKIQIMTSEIARQQALSERLENDLLSVNDHVKLSYGPTFEELSIASPISHVDEKRNNGPEISFVPSADTSILPIVTSQRDRFRLRNAELEEELRRQSQIISELKNEIKSLQSDNLKLYEKVRYMQSYTEEAGLRQPISQLDPLPAPRSRLDDINKYQRQYEEAMNPFEAFRGREAIRAHSNLNLLERCLLTLTRYIHGGRRARTIFIVYGFALHAVVIYYIYQCSS